MDTKNVPFSEKDGKTFATHRLSLEAHNPAGIPVASQGWQPTRKSSPWSPICIFGSPLCRDLQPGLAQFPVESRPASRHRGELPVPHSSLRSNRSPLASRGQAGQRRRRRLISDDLATASFPSGSDLAKSRGRGSPTAAVHRPAAPEPSKQNRDPQRRLRRLRFSSHPLSGSWTLGMRKLGDSC